MTTTTLQLDGTRFGAIDYVETDVVEFAGGLIGFPDLHLFLILAHKENSPFRWLQSVDEPAIAFLTTDPVAYVESYGSELYHIDVRALGIDESTPALVLTTAAIPGGNVDAMTLNLAAPIVINLSSRQGKQFILDGDYEVRYQVFQKANAA